MIVAEEDLINVSTQLLSSLLDQIPIIESFRGKWSIVRTKLSDLRTQLADFTDFPTSSSNPLSLDLLRAIATTLSDAVSLAGNCRNQSVSQGKLKIQSDLDAVLAKLDRHIRDSEILFRSGVLHDGVVPGSGSNREAIRAESRNLITRLQIGCPDSKTSAMIMNSLLRLLEEDDKHVMIAVAQGVVPVLVRQMDSTSGETKERTVAAISRVSMVESSRHVLIAEGLMLLKHLLRVLESGSGFAKEKACLALRALSISREHAMEIGTRGAISSLLEICQTGTPNSQAIAAGVLRNLTAVSEIRESLVEENAILVLLGLAASGTALGRENAIGCLSNLVSDDENLKILIVREGGIECLKNFWDSSPSTSSLEVAVELLNHLASCPPVAEILISNDFLSRLVGVLSCGVLSVRIGAARAVYELSYLSTRTRREMGERGCIASLVKMLDGKAVEEKEAAAKALSVLVLSTGNRRIFRQEERGIVSMVLLLDPCVCGLDKKYPISVLACLVHSKKCRKEMVDAGACVYLQKLADMEVEGAKKLSESLARGRMWRPFS